MAAAHSAASGSAVRYAILAAPCCVVVVVVLLAPCIEYYSRPLALSPRTVLLRCGDRLGDESHQRQQQ